jgi:quercetin dioxygenase-like cupin family protein
MQRLDRPSAMLVDPGRFTGDAWVDALATGAAPSRLRLALVRFAPGSRTAWHRHRLGQTLHVTDGLGLVQNRAGALILLRPGDTVHTPPGEWHWHGALPDRFMSHMAISETAADQTLTDVDWADHVLDGDYRAASAEVARSTA